MTNVSFGIKTSQNGISYDEILRIWREADRLPAFEHAWLWDHLTPLRGPIDGAALEAWTLLAALAAQTERLRLGVLVTSNRLRSPALLAKMAATVDVISGGRLEFGLGAGGSRAPGSPRPADDPGVREFAAYGVPLVSGGQAVRELAEACTVIRRLWSSHEPFDHDGPALKLRGAVCEPKPIQRPHPPILLAGRGDRLLRVVAEHADVWNYPGGPSEDFHDRDRFLTEACTAIGRDPATIARSMQTIVRCSEPGSAGSARDVILAMIDAGVRHVVIAPILHGRPVEWVTDKIVGPVRDRL